MVLSTVQNAHIEFVAALQQLVSTMENSLEKDSLLLSFGALASNTQADVKLTIATFFMQQMSSVNSNDSSAIVHLLLAMGNTGSDYAVSTIIEYVNHPLLNIQKAAIKALVKFTYLEQVQSSLHEFLAPGPNEEILNIVTKILIDRTHMIPCNRYIYRVFKTLFFEILLLSLLHACLKKGLP